MSEAATAGPPRVRTRASLEAEPELTDLAERAMRGDLPEGVASAARSAAARNSPELMPLIFDALFRLRTAGVPHDEIARKFGVHPRTEYRWWERARPWLREKFVDLDPAEVYAGRMAEFDLRQARLFELFMEAEDGREAVRLSRALDRLFEIRLRWMVASGYFDLIRPGDVFGQDADPSVRGARALREALDVFSDYDETADAPIEQWQPWEDGAPDLRDLIISS